MKKIYSGLFVIITFLFAAQTSSGQELNLSFTINPLETIADPGDFDLSKYFADDIYTIIKGGVTKEQILADADMPTYYKMAAVQIMDGTYPFYRTQEYKPYRPTSNLASEFKTNQYNQYENPTGIMLEAGKEVIIFVPDTKGEQISIRYKNWTSTSESTYTLRKGINRFKPSITSLAYVSYFTTNYKTAQPIKLHIIGGQINGYFDRNKHTAEDWEGVLNNAVATHLDIIGDYTNMVFHVASLKTSCKKDGMRLIELYDEIIQMQFEQMGLFKYNKVPTNHMLGRNMESGFMHADGYGAAFQNATMSSIGNPKAIISGDNSWGIAHEYGHVNQLRPALTWVGTTEVTNNIYSSYAQYMLTSKYSTLRLRLEHEGCTDIQGGVSVVGGRFNSHLHYGVLKGDNWMFQWGQDHKIENGIYKADHFVKLVPIWQLTLYFKIVEAEWSKPDWFADMCEAVRNDNASYTHGQRQMNFIKRACEYTETDLTEFFERAGLLKPIDERVDDYTAAQLTITQTMCDEVKQYVKGKGWQKPAGVVNYISGNSVKIYQDQLPVEGVLNEGISGESTDEFRTVDHSVWKNAVVYETYSGEELVRITMTGTGVTNNLSTRVPFPKGATKIVAVSWDNQRQTVYEQ